MTYRRVTYYGFSRVNKRPCGGVAHGYTDFLALSGITTEIEVVFVAVLFLSFDDGGCPCVALGPFHLVASHVEHCALILPFLEVGRGITGIIPATPTRHTVGGGVYVVAFGFVGV